MSIVFIVIYVFAILLAVVGAVIYTRKKNNHSDYKPVDTELVNYGHPIKGGKKYFKIVNR